MARNNIMLGNDPAFKPGGYAPAPQYGQQGFGQPSTTQPAYGQPAAQQAYSPHDLEAMYNQPSATASDTGRMTWRDAMNAITASLGTVIVLGALVMALPMALGLVLGEQGVALGYLIGTGAAIIGAIGGLVLIVINMFRKKPSAALTLGYAAFEGLFVGGISSMFEAMYPGIVFQAVLGTLAVAATVLVLFRMGWVRTSPRLNKIFMVALGAYVLFSLANLVIVLFGGGSLRTGLLGLAIGAFAVLLASYSLVMDFELITNGVNNGAPRNYAWMGALGITVTMVWLYVEILRILAILRDN